MSSFPGLAFGIINVVGNFGTVFVDQAYWQGMSYLVEVKRKHP